MGDIADMLLDGTLCESCGVYLGSDNDFPTKCRSCQREQNIEDDAALKSRLRKAKCTVCGKKVKEIGMRNHMKDAHGVDAALTPKDKQA